jgi:GMP synthase-like glutamine amidotransferase
MPSCLVVQHVAPESAFVIGDALADVGVGIDVLSVFRGAEVPSDCSGFDGLVVMGGPMSATSDHDFPTREAEIKLIADALDRSVPTLGICLGAQLLAVAGGASVYPGSAGFEIGWAPVELTPACVDDGLFAGLPQHLDVMHWHGDTFDLPGGAERLIGNSTYANQGFRIGTSAWGLQFHLEVTESAVDGFLTAFPADAARVTGGVDAIRNATPSAIAALAGSRDTVVGRFARLVAAQAKRGDLVESN